MGVKNLWRLLLPTAHRISIETLSNQTLAIDASIWMTQISKACRDQETGRLLPNRPHVRIFLLRLMRLLYHRIRPVIVFDGTFYFLYIFIVVAVHRIHVRIFIVCMMYDVCILLCFFCISPLSYNI